MTTIKDVIEKASSGAYGEDSETIAKVFGWVATVKFDMGIGPFICGTVGKEGSDGLHEGYLICPTYGVDANMTKPFFQRTACTIRQGEPR